MFIYHANYSARAPRLFIRPISPLRARTHTHQASQPVAHTRAYCFKLIARTLASSFIRFIQTLYITIRRRSLVRARWIIQKKRGERTRSRPRYLYTLVSFPLVSLERATGEYVCVCTGARFVHRGNFARAGKQNARERERARMYVYTHMHIRTHVYRRACAGERERMN